MKQLVYIFAVGLMVTANHIAGSPATDWTAAKRAYLANPSAENAAAVRAFLYSGANAVRMQVPGFMKQHNIPEQAPVDTSAADARAAAAEAAQRAAEAAQTAEIARRAASDARVQQLMDDMDAARKDAATLKAAYDLAAAQVAALSAGSPTAANLADAMAKLDAAKKALDAADATWQAKVNAVQADKDAALVAVTKLKEANDTLDQQKRDVTANFTAAQATIAQLKVDLAAKGGTVPPKKGLSVADLKKAVDNWMGAFNARKVAAGNALFDRVAAVKANLEKKPRALLPKAADWNKLKADMIAYLRANPVVKPAMPTPDQKKQTQQLAVINGNPAAKAQTAKDGLRKRLLAKGGIPADIQAKFDQVAVAPLSEADWKALIAQVNKALSATSAVGSTGAKDAAILKVLRANVLKGAGDKVAKDQLVKDIEVVIRQLTEIPGKPAVKAAKGVKAVKAVPAKYRVAPADAGVIDALRRRASVLAGKGGVVAPTPAPAPAPTPVSAADAKLQGYVDALPAVADVASYTGPQLGAAIKNGSPLMNAYDSLVALAAAGKAADNKDLAAAWLKIARAVLAKLPATAGATKAYSPKVDRIADLYK